MSERVLHVAVAVIQDSAGRVLVAQRLPHQHLAGFWEFPGGKLEPGETLAQGMRREIHEELGVVVEQLAPLLRVEHHYPEKTVLLDVWRIVRWSGSPSGREGQPLRWLYPDEMLLNEFPPADVPIIAALRLPVHYVISPDITTLAQRDAFVARVAAANIRLVQIRLATMPALAWPLLCALRRALPQQAKLLINSQTLAAWQAARAAGDTIADTVPMPVDALDAYCGADGIHLTADDLRACTSKPAVFASASCHDAESLQLAYALGLDFATLSPVLPTASHPDAVPLGWVQFSAWVQAAGLPVFALGGMRPAMLRDACAHGAAGIAGISQLLP